jgi:GTP-binding protein
MPPIVPGGPSAPALEFGRLLFRRECRFVAGAAAVAQVPETELPEVAFAGRSNVGKSSLLNALVGRRGLARVSKAPGRTREINFFDLGGRLMLADLPGYGYARAAKAEVAAWTRLIRGYLDGRRPLCRVCLLIDGRRGVGDGDLAAMALMDEAAQSYQAVLTKCDKLKPAEAAARADETARALASRPAAHPVVVVTSARTGAGLDALRAALAALAARP